MDNESIVTAIECEYGVRAIQSEAQGLYYLEDDEKKYIGILVVKDGIPMHVILKKKQALALAKEFKDICEMRFGY